MKEIGSAQNIENFYEDIINKYRPLVISKLLNNTKPVLIYNCDCESRKNSYKLFTAVFFTGTPFYVYGVTNLDGDVGAITASNAFSLEDFLFDMVDMVLTYFQDNTFRHKRKIVLDLGQDLLDSLVEFNGSVQEITDEISEDIYSSLTDIDLIEDYMDMWYKLKGFSNYPMVSFD